MTDFSDTYTDWLELYRFGRAQDLFIFDSAEPVSSLTEDFDNLAKVFEACQQAVGDVVSSAASGSLTHSQVLGLFQQVASVWGAVDMGSYTLNHRRLIGYVDAVHGVIDWALYILDDPA